MKNSLFTLLLFFSCIVQCKTNIFSQTKLPECQSNVPFFILDLSSSPDSTYTTPEIVRTGQCCGDNNNQNYVSFYVKLHPDVAMVEIGIAPGYADPGGSGFYNIVSGGDINTPGTCGTNIAGGHVACITGVGPYKITYHKPGSNKVKYYLKQIPKPIFPIDQATRIGCTLPLAIYGLNNIVITSIKASNGDTVRGTYDSLFSCIDCPKPVFTPQNNTPYWIDYQICGNPQASACGTYASCDTIRLYTFQKLNVQTSPTPAQFCVGSSGVTLKSEGIGGDGNYSYTWTNSFGTVLSTSDTCKVAVAGNYFVEVNDGLTTATCQGISKTVNVQEGKTPILNAGSDQFLCATNPQASISGNLQYVSGIYWTGGTGTYTPNDTLFLPAFADSPQTVVMSYTPSHSEIQIGSVTLNMHTLGAAGGCTDTTDQLTMHFSDTLKLDLSAAAIACKRQTSSIQSAVSGGILPYSYFWSTGEHSSTSIVPAGTYSLSVFDSIGCSVTSVINISEPNAIELSLSSTNTTTDIACDGNASVSISGGTEPYTIHWDNGQTTLGTTNTLCYGIHNVVITDSFGCIKTGSVVVNKPSCSSFNVTAVATDLVCFGDKSGIATASASGGVAPYSYTWNSIPPQYTVSATGLSGGTYTITVKDSVGCVDLASVSIKEPTIISDVITHVDVSVSGGNNGNATVYASGGTPGYTYLWIPGGQTTQTAVNLTSSVSGVTYYVQIKDSNLCLKSDSVKINQPPCDSLNIYVNTTNATCNGLANGEAYIVISDGTGPYAIHWSSGVTDVTSISGLAAGTYNVTVTDSKLCSTFETFSIAQPNPLSLGVSPTNITCFGKTDGTVELTVTGGTFPYNFTWTKNGNLFGSQEDLANLGVGMYHIMVTDVNGCSLSDSVKVTQPNQITVPYNYVDNICNGESFGSINISPSGGVYPYQFQWTGPSNFSANTEDISNLSKGLYELHVTDANACEFNSTQVYINQPDSLIIKHVTVPCPIPGNTSVTVSIDSISGGVGGSYKISYDNGSTFSSFGNYSQVLPVDSLYHIWAKDSNNCISKLPYQLTIDTNVTISNVVFNPCIPVGITSIPVTVQTTGGNNGNYAISTNSGTSWNPFGTYTISIPVGTSYSIQSKDTKNCKSVIYPISIPHELVIDAQMTRQVSCNGLHDGSAHTLVTGGVEPYSFVWIGPSGYNAHTEEISSLYAGNYSVSVRDSNQCVKMDTILITTVTDTTKPIIACTDNQHFNTSSGTCNYQYIGTALNANASDNCLVSSLLARISGVTTGSNLTSLSNVIFNHGITHVVWEVTDGSGNKASCTFNVTVTDIQIPTIIACGANGNQTVQTDVNECTYTHSGTAWDASASDNCSAVSVSYTLSGTTAGTGTSLDNVVFNPGTTLVTWTASDTSGNISTCSFAVSVFDEQIPTIIACGANGNQTVQTDVNQCTYKHSGTVWDATASDNCSAVSLSYTLSGATSGTGTSLNNVVFNPGTTLVMWTASDTSGNVSTCSFTVNVTDEQTPTIIACGANGNQTVQTDVNQCTYTHRGTAWDASASDNCSAVSLNYTLSGSTAGTGTSLDNVVFNPGTTLVAWTASDTSGNVSTCSFAVSVFDEQIPTIITCGANGNQTVQTDVNECTYTHSGTAWDARASDNCSAVSLSYTLSGSTAGTGTSLNNVVFNPGTTLVTWTASDTSGNVSTCSFAVSLIDEQTPTIIACGANGNQTVQTDVNQCVYTHSGTAWDASASDNCSAVSLNYTLSGATAGTGTSLNNIVFNPGTTLVTWTASDTSGNVSTCSFAVSVIDEQAPTIINCNNGITITSIPDQCGTYVYWDDPIITDNCSFTLSQSHVSGSFFEVGTTLVTYTATDTSGNSSTCSFYVTVKDTSPAIVTCSRPINSCDSYIVYPLPTALDNCGVQSIIQISGLPSGSNFPVGLTNNIFEVTDIHGNTASCSVNVTVFPTPVVTLNTTNVRCFGEQNGSIDLSVSSPNVYYTYLWSNNAQTQDINGLAAGTYSVYVSDEYGCNAVSETTIYEPQNLLISAEKQNVSCFGGNDGSVQVSVLGGVLPYNYLWSNGQTTSLASQLIPGVYSILVTDVNRCVRSYETNISQPDSLVTNFTIKNAICNASNGSINVAVTGGTVPYNFNWSNQTNGPTLSNVVAGNYTLVIQDGNNCTYRYSKTIGTIHNFYASMNATDVTCQGSSNGSIDFVLRGNSPFTFEWFGDNPVNLDSVSSGTYLVHITDSFGCDTTITILIQEPDSLAISLTSETYSTGTNISTYQGQDGSILSTVTGGTEPYLYNWSNGEASENIYNLSAGSYVLTVTDANGCITKAGILLTEPYLLEMPSGFSPNGDGSNDFFVVRGIEYYSHNEITVYNRWGNKVYSKTYYSNEWNGDNNQGESLPDGTYFVILTVFNEPDITLKHYVDLRR